MTDKPFTPRSVEAASRTPLDDDAFAALMARLGPFERSPHLAVGVSGGADSLSLALLADVWARNRGGRITALIVDHGLRAESALEARDVKARLVERGIVAEILTWQGRKPTTGVQAAARAARFDLMGGWLARHGVLHLLLGHHRDDQAETFLMRLDGKSGLDGLSAMASISERRGYRVVRPFLHVPKAQLIATVTKHKMRWIEDPSNQNRTFARVRVRTDMADGGGLSVGRAAHLARRIGDVRLALETETWTQLGTLVELNPVGFATLDVNGMRGLPERLGMRVLMRTLQCIGGRVHSPRTEKTARLWQALMNGEVIQGRTLGGCRILSVSGSEDGGLLVCRENRSLPDPLAALPDQVIRWDGRFALEIARDPEGHGAGWIAPLGREGWRQVVEMAPALRTTAVPPQVRPGLPALWDDAGVVAQPHLGFLRINHVVDAAKPGVCLENARFCPQHSLSGLGFCLV